jgi:hypothetical protein
MFRIFSVFVIFISALGLTACSGVAEDRSAVSTDITAVIQPFFEAVRHGDQNAAEKYVAPGFLQDSKVQFAEMSAILKNAPRLAPVIQQKQGTGAYLTFAGKHGKLWVTSELRVARYGNKPMIEYWDVNVAEAPPTMAAHAQNMREFIANGLLALAICALGALAALIWAVRNRSHLFGPIAKKETRRVAVTTRNIES